jgi:hypothetical protein
MGAGERVASEHSKRQRELRNRVHLSRESESTREGNLEITTEDFCADSLAASLDSTKTPELKS